MSHCTTRCWASVSVCWCVGGTLTELSHGSVSGCWWVVVLPCCWTPVLFSGSLWSALCLFTKRKRKVDCQCKIGNFFLDLLSRSSTLNSRGSGPTFVWEPAWLWTYADGSAVLLVLWWSTQIIPHTLGADAAQVRALCLDTLVHSVLLRWPRNGCNHQH